MQLHSESFSLPVTATKPVGETYAMHDDASTESSRAQKKAPLGMGPTFPHFRKLDVTDDCLACVIDLARHAASEGNLQPWRWIVVRSEGGKKRLESASHGEVPLSDAPVILICLSDTLAWKSAPQRLQEMVAIEKITEEQAREFLRRVQEFYSASPEVAQRTAVANGLAAAQQVLLGAASCGLSAYSVTEFVEAKIKTHFHIPDQFTVAALLPVGYREESPAPPPTQSAPSTFVYQEKFGKLLRS
jgi:nitroreductase